MVLGTSDWCMVIEEERRSKTEKRKKENADKEEEKKVCAFHFILCGSISVFEDCNFKFGVENER